MKISVVTVSFNSSATIRDTIESFLEQSWTAAEMLIVDGASADGTARIALSYGDPRIRVLSEPDRGIYDAMNKGLRLFEGDAVGFLNSDDRFHGTEALAQIVAGLAEADVVFGNLDFVADHRTRRVVRRWRQRPYVPGGFRRGWMPAHPTCYMRRSVAERTGLFDVSYKIAADYDFMLRAIEAVPESERPRLQFIDDTLIDMKHGGASTSGLGGYVRGNLESLRSRRKWLGVGAVDYALFAKPLGKLGQLAPRGSA